MGWQAENIAAAEADGAVDHAWFVQIISATVTLRLFTGSIADITFNSATFVAEDATYGTLGEIDEFEEGFEPESPRPVIRIHPPSDEAAAALVAALDENTVVQVYLGFIDDTTGQVAAHPEVIFDGYVDVPSQSVGHGRSLVELECITFAERFHDAGEGLSMNTASHQSIFPGERGFDLINERRRQYWGGAAPSSSDAVVNLATKIVGKNSSSTR